MIFFDLPIEICVIIINYLDLPSKINLYNASKSLRKLFAPCHLKRLNLSRSRIATAKTLQEVFFLHLGNYVQDLNLSGIQDLTVKTLKLHVTKMHNLQSLDVTFTNIFLSDITQICPNSLKNISINFFKDSIKCKQNGNWKNTEDFFKEIKFCAVHFVVFDLHDRDSPLRFLKDVTGVQDVKVTIADNYEEFENDFITDYDSHVDETFATNFSTLSYFIRDCRVTHKTSYYLKGIRNLDYEKIEYIFIMYLERIQVFISPIFAAFFRDACSDLEVKVCTVLPQDFMLDLNIVFKAWNKDTTDFNDDFFNRLREDLRDYFPTYICMRNKITMRLMDVASDWYCIDSCQDFEQNLDFSPTKLTLTDFCRRNGSLLRRSRPIKLSPGVESLSKLTFMRLSNVWITDDFFPILFSSCPHLQTLDLYVESRDRMDTFEMYINSLAKSAKVANNLKNIKLTTEDIDYERLFACLSKFSGFQNIHICEYERALRGFVDTANLVLLIERCTDLYSLFIESDMTAEELTLLLAPLKETAQKIGRLHLCIEVCDCYRGWNPFVDVFNPSPLHILD